MTERKEKERREKELIGVGPWHSNRHNFELFVDYRRHNLSLSLSKRTAL